MSCGHFLFMSSELLPRWWSYFTLAAATVKEEEVEVEEVERERDFHKFMPPDWNIDSLCYGRRRRRRET